MGWKGKFSRRVSLLALASFLIGLVGAPVVGADPVTLQTRTEGFAFTDLTTHLPDGMERVLAAAPHPEGAVFVGESASGPLILAVYRDASQSLVGPWTYLPAHYGRVSAAAQIGSHYVLAGESVGIAPVLGVYDASSSAFWDATRILTSDVIEMELVVGGVGRALLMFRGINGISAALFAPATGEFELLEQGAFENLVEVRAGVWGVSAFYVAGETKAGEPTLLAVHPDGTSVDDLSPSLPESLDRIQSVVWGEDALYLAGYRLVAGPTATLARFVPDREEIVSLAHPVLAAHTRIEGASWNGTSLLLLSGAPSRRTLGVFAPEKEAFHFLHDLVPEHWTTPRMVSFSEDLLVAGNYWGAELGAVRLPSQTWEDLGNVFEGPFRTIYDVEATASGFAVVGGRTSTAAFGLWEPDTWVFQDQSHEVGLESSVLVAATSAGDSLLLAGANHGQGSLYHFRPSTGELSDLSSNVPEDVWLVADGAWNGSAYLLSGLQGGRPALLLLSQDGETIQDLSVEAGGFFERIDHLLGFSERFLILGRNEEGLALVTLDAETGAFAYRGDAFGRWLGQSGVLAGAAWNGESFLLGGTRQTGPVLLLWSPTQGIVQDLSGILPGEVRAIHSVLWTAEGFWVGGEAMGGAALSLYRADNRSFTDFSSLLPASYDLVTSMAAGESGILLASVRGSPVAQMGFLQLSSETGAFDVVLRFVREPLLAATLGIVFVLAALAGYVVGRGRRRIGAAARQSPPRAWRSTSVDAESREEEATFQRSRPRVQTSRGRYRS